MILLTVLNLPSALLAANRLPRQHPVPWLAETTGETHFDGGFRPDSTELDSFIIRFMESGNIPGLATCIVKDEVLIWNNQYGYADIGRNILVADCTLFMLASISKTVTSVALMKLWEDGELGLDDNVSDYLPFDVVNPNQPAEIITFRHLLTHTSGIADNWLVMPYYPGDSPIPLNEYLENYLVPGGQYYYPNLNFHNWAPGTDYSYCNNAVALVGYLAQQIRQLPFEIFCREFIFYPLDMYETEWFLADLDTADIALPYYYSGGSYTSYGHFGYSDYPSGQLRTSASQLANFLTMFMTDGMHGSNRLLYQSTIDTMMTIQFPEVDDSQGLIWYTFQLGGRTLWGHSGGDQGVSTDMYFCPEENSGVIALNNGETYMYELVDAMFDYAAEYGVSVADEDIAEIPSTFELLPPYPNPFNSTASVTFTISVEQFIELSVYNLLGKKISTLYKGEKPPGVYDMHIDGHNMTSGLYFVKLSISGNQNSAIRKLVLLK